MAIKRPTTLRARVLLSVGAVVFAAFAITIAVLTAQATALQRDVSFQYAEQLATSNARQVAARVDKAMDAARVVSQSLRGLKVAGATDRAAADSLLKGVLEGNPEFLGVWTCWEPNAFDGKDADFVGKPAHDATGRYVPYWNRGAGAAAVEPLTDYDKPGAGDYYQLAKNSGNETLLEPYMYKVAGKDVLMTTVVVPIKINGKFVGVAGVDLALSNFQDQVGKIRLFDTGFASLISNAGVFVADIDAKNVAKDIGTSESAIAVKAAVKAGQKYDTRGFSEQLKTQATSIYVPVQIGAAKTPWSFMTTMADDKVLASANRLRNMAIAIAVVSILVVSIGLNTLLNKMVLRPIGGEPSTATDIAGRVAQGDLTGHIETAPGDQFSMLSQLKTMQAGLSEVVAAVRRGSEGVATASAEIAQGNHDLSARTESQASALEETAASMEELGSTVKQNADAARQANLLAMNASTVAVRGGAVVGQVVETMKGINESSRKISDIISVIDGIAFQTNILALNAAVEAARAGEQGRGFAVVASEVRSLAGRSADAAKEIKTLINDSVDRVERGSTLVDEAGTTMSEVVSSIRRVTDIMGEISSASSEQSAGVAQVVEAVNQIDQSTQQNAALVEQMAAAASSLQSQADELVKTVAVFKLNT
ncbi:MAG: methyl-accepting chemotaxis protein [Aquabacterium sp.]|nr:methyl-accepting chemotaxis protein [Aquabacterium sp.]